LAAGAFALLGLIAWLCVYATGVLPLRDQPPPLWHGHEMLYGFVGAAIAGFLLTAVPSWTGTRGFAGAPLILLAALWLLGRLAFAGSAALPFWLVAACELAFFPVLIVLLAPPLLRARNRNTPLLLVLIAIWIGDAVFLYALARGEVLLARTMMLVAIDVVLLLVTVIGGRIVPVFTANALRSRGEEPGIRGSARLDGVVIGAMVVVVLVDAAAPGRPLAGVVAGLAAGAQAWRMSRWRSMRTFHDPMVWSLHLAYAWLPVGLALKATNLLTGAPWAALWLHALTIGVAASMVLAVMTRAALGHTGRPLVAARTTAMAYVLLSAAAVVRVFTPSLTDVEYRWTVMTAGVLWIAAFALFLVIYTPILTRPRIDGRGG
jgi:uncharacterized protein involved in response to NO